MSLSRNRTTYKTEPFAAPGIRVAGAARHAALLPWLAALAAAAFAFALRAYRLDQSFEIFIDEITYLRLAEGTVKTLGVVLYGEPFFLHPPAFFYLEGLFLALVRPAGNLVEQIYVIRYLNVGLAALTTGLLLLAGWRIGGPPAGIVAAALYSLESFVIKMNSLNLIETSAILWVVAGYTVLLLALGDYRRQITSRETVAAGLLFGLALLSKDMTAFLTLLPLGACFVLGWVMPRRRAVQIAAITALTYVPYPLLVVLTGNASEFVDQKFRGLLRLIGLVKETGFNRHPGSSFLQTLIARLDQFGLTYLIIALGALAVAVLLVWFWGRAVRLLALWGASAYALLAYSVAFGTLEEQFFYFLIVPALLTIAVAGTLVLRSPQLEPRLRRALLVAAAVLGLAFVGWSGYQWSRVHLVPSNGYESLLRYLEENVAPGARVAATSETAQFLLGRYGSGPWSSWYSLQDLRAHHPDFVLVDAKQVAWDYGADAGELLQWLEQNGRPVFTFQHSRGSTLVLYRLPLDW